MLFINTMEKSGKSEISFQTLHRILKIEVAYLKGEPTFRNSADKHVNDNFFVLLQTVVGISIKFYDQIQRFDTLFFLSQYQN